MILALALAGTLASACTKDLASPTAHGIIARAAPTGAVAPIDAASWALADRLTTRTYTSDTTAALLAGLARSGIGTFADPSAAHPEQSVGGSVSAMRLLDFQAHALAVGAWAGGGFSGTELDTAIPQTSDRTDMPTTSELLAGYVAAADTPGGSLARALMAGQNLLAPATLRFPAVVLVLFAADLAGPAAPVAGESSGAAWQSMTSMESLAAAAPAAAAGVAPAAMTIPAERQTAGGICSAAANWINNTIAGFFAALRLATPNSLAGAVVVSIWNWLVGAAQAFVQKLIGALTDAVLSTIRNIARVVSVAAENIASLLPYAIKVVASGDAGGGTFTLGSQPLSGRFTATVSAGDLPAWPDVLADCAEVTKIKLPDFRSKDIALTWGPLDAMGDPMLDPTEPGHTTDVTDANGQASWGFATKTDPGDPSGEIRSQVDSMPVTVHRPEIRKAEDSLTYSLLGDIPELLRPYVARSLAPYIDGLQSRLNALLDARGGGIAILVYHDPAPPTPKPTGPVTSIGCTRTPVAPGTYTGTDTDTFAEKIPMSGGALTDHSTATGAVTMTIAADGTLTGTWSFHMRNAFTESINVSGVSAKYQNDSTWAMSDGTITGTVCNIALQSGSMRQLTCVGTCGDSAAEPAPPGVVPDQGAPVVTAGGHLTWRMRKDATDGTYTDTFVIAVAGPH